MHPDPHCYAETARRLAPLEADFDRRFAALYRDLRGALPHPFDWLDVLICPPWWRLRARAAHRRVAWVFAWHGLLLTEPMAREFLYATERQQPHEDAGGSIVRRLRQVFQWQMGVPYSCGPRRPRMLHLGGPFDLAQGDLTHGRVSVIDGGRRDG